MKIDVLTLFPEMLEPMLSQSILGRAIDNGYLTVDLHNIRDYTENKHRSTDDYPFGGGAGMVMFAQPIVDAVDAVDPNHRARRIYLSPRGRTLNQHIVEELSGEDALLLLCGHYEGVDQRALDLCVDEELSIGDYILTGGELGALVVIDAVARLIPGVLGSEESSEEESFTTGLLEYPQYTRPAEFRGNRVPSVLLGGNHKDITAWRREQSLILTRRNRPDLLAGAPLDDEDRAILKQLDDSDRAISALDAAGIPARRLSYAEAESFPKRWFNAFVPDIRRKAAKKQCFSGRRHVGFLWQAFSMDFAPHIDGAEAKIKSKTGMRELYLPDASVLLRLGSDPESLPFGHYILTDEDMTRTYVQTFKEGVGPFYAGKA